MFNGIAIWNQSVGGVSLPFEVNDVARFNGMDETISLGATTDFDFAFDEAFSLTFWMYMSVEDVFQNVFSNRSSNSPFIGWNFQITSNNVLRYTMRNAQGTNELQFDTQQAFVMGQWYYIALVLDGTGSFSGVKVYINSVDSALTSLVDTLLNTPDYTGITPYIGSLENSLSYMNGYLSNITLFNKALSGIEVAGGANGTKPANLANHSAVGNIISWYQLSANANDSIGSNNGTLVNMDAANFVLNPPDYA